MLMALLIILVIMVTIISILNELIKFWNDSEDDDRLTYNDFHRATTGFLIPYGYEDHLDYKCAHRADDIHHDTFNQPYRSSYFLFTK